MATGPAQCPNYAGFTMDRKRHPAAIDYEGSAGSYPHQAGNVSGIDITKKPLSSWSRGSESEVVESRI
ncbi:hypothetical protein CSPX01_15727 [Colletotrichum filicis]|nr:hypothetical protein CSPX01_15727 [Colletotrichum filicis]